MHGYLVHYHSKDEDVYAYQMMQKVIQKILTGYRKDSQIKRPSDCIVLSQDSVGKFVNML